MNIYVNQCQPINYCSNTDDYRPIQSTLLTRFSTTTNPSEIWRTTNQEYGAFYYQTIPQYCIPDNLKAKTHRRYNRFQEWITYQTKCQNSVSSLSPNDNNQTIFPSNTNETVRITHRKRFVSECDNELDRNTFSSCGEDGLITEYIVKKILNKLQSLINPDEYHDVVECAQILVSEILSQEPSLCTNEIIDRVITIMITPPNNSNSSISCPSPQQLHDNIQKPNTTTVSVSEPLINCNDTLPVSNVFEKLTDLENAISKISNHLVKI